ncbi:MAG: leucyl/phenylalanyl-tRNA--protein transferase [Alphaproteobacteria bacterium]|nr:leucyl/phenylalanyl-tRNA--protein transferase [Alphaproteobacteria bacterium]
MAVIDPDVLLRAYAIGVFPMSDGRDADEVFWVEPKRRAVIPLDGFRLSHSLRKTIRSDRFEVGVDGAFEEVIRRCAAREETWINSPIEASFVRLHALGFAHSVECRRGGDLVGGLYGVALGRAFFGESMFSAETDASKVALAWLVARLKAGGYTLLDCQFMTDHLRTLGAVEISKKAYLGLLSEAVSTALAVGGNREGAAGPGAAVALRVGDFGALDRLLAAALAEGGAATSSPGRFIAQLLGQTS